ncbi:hypothetical protein QTO34_017022 [Cnephaeus nilssonii]|uniref:Uncharacterized protein n=1 Tax=Cnephaeus nilssonii TaxID=3371016 RepID=A0AA40I176_CNENI|nr:hypothetical protein QTO34_017022 [Eptesicus nilssonii]
MQSAWKKLWPVSVAEQDFEGFEDEPVFVVENILSLGKSMGLEVDDDDVKDHNTELATKNSKTFRGSSNRRQLRSSLPRKKRERRILLFH